MTSAPPRAVLALMLTVVGALPPASAPERAKVKIPSKSGRIAGHQYLRQPVNPYVLARGAARAGKHLMQSRADMMVDSAFELPVERASEPTRPRALADQVPVWVHGFTRSGSSTMLSMVTQAGRARRNPTEYPDPSNADNVFAIFEPCDPRDGIESWLNGCTAFLEKLGQCNFHAVKSLWNWNDVHTFTRGADAYSPMAAKIACKGADVLAFKTVERYDTGFRLIKDGLPLLDYDKRFKMIDIVRDPRSIYASWMSTFPFNDTNMKSGVARDHKHLLNICLVYESGLNVQHDRMMRVLFEELVSSPRYVMQRVSDFLDAPFGEEQERWINETFSADDCPGVNEYIAAYSDCHTDSQGTIEHWRRVLTADEMKIFLEDPHCKKVISHYGYPAY